MARIDVRGPAGELVRPLATSTLLGRHHACTWRVPGPRVPLYWLELRWMGHWAWRVLVGEEETRGPGRVLAGGFRRLKEGDRIQGPGEVSVSLLEGGAPEPFAVDEHGEARLGDALDAIVETRADGAWPTDAERDPDRTEPLQDGQLFRCGGRAFRFHDGQAPSATVRSVASLASDRCELEVRPEGAHWQLTVIDGGGSAEVAAEHVRVLLPYIEARQQDMPRGGWLELDAAHFRWQQRGGRAGSDRDRIAQDRSRLCRALARRGVAAAAQLFETARTSEGWVTRISLPPDRITLSE